MTVIYYTEQEKKIAYIGRKKDILGKWLRHRKLLQTNRRRQFSYRFVQPVISEKKILKYNDETILDTVRFSWLVLGASHLRQVSTNY